MRNKDDIRYRGVPAEISRELADECWEFGDAAHWILEDLETAVKRIFNARLTTKPKEWAERIDEARGHLDNVQDGLKQLRKRLRQVERMSPKQKPGKPDRRA